MKNKSLLQSVLIGLFVVLMLAASNSIVRAQSPPTTSWIGTTGDWFDCTHNWSPGCPNGQVQAFIDNKGQALIDGSGAYALTQSLTLGSSRTSSGGVSVSDSAILDVFDGSCRGDFYIGNQGSGGLSITSGGIVRSRHGYIGAQSKSNGSVTVKGSTPNSSSQWNLFGSAGNGCPDAGLFIGCTAPCTDTDGSYAGGTALVNVESPALISVVSFVDATNVKVGLSGTLTGNGTLEVFGSTAASQTAVVFGTLAPPVALASPGPVLTIKGNLQLERQATTVFNVTPQIPQNVAQLAVVTIPGGGGGTAALEGRVSVTATGSNYTPGMTFTLLHAEVSLGATQFFSQSINFPPNLECFIPEITYDANNVYLFLKPCH